jgi:hypothetical protein
MSFSDAETSALDNDGSTPPERFEIPASLEASFLQALNNAGGGPGDYLSEVVTAVWPSVTKSSASTNEAAPIKMVLLDFDHPESTNIFSTSSCAVKVGLREVSEFCQMSIRLTEHLTRIFTRRMCAMGDIPGPSAFVSLDDYPEAALKTVARSEIDGYALSIVDKWKLSTLQALDWADRGKHDQQIDLSVETLGDIDLNVDRQDYRIFCDPPDGSYLIRLHHWILCHALYFVLSHEVGHIALNHFASDCLDSVEQRQQEIEADRYALRAEPFQTWVNVKTALWVFGFLAAEKPTSAADLTHPYSLDRLQILGRILMQCCSGKGMMTEISSIIRQFPSNHGVFARQGSDTTFELSSASGLDSAFLTVATRKEYILGPDEQAPSANAGSARREFPQFYRARLAYCDPLNPDTEFFAATAYFNILGRLRTARYDDNLGLNKTEFLSDRRVRTTVKSAIEILTPPAWRLSNYWGVMKITAVEPVDDLPEALGAPGEDGNMPKIMWCEEMAKLLAIDDLRKGADVKSFHDLLVWADCCEEFGYPDDAFALRSAVVEENPILAGYHVAIAIIDELRNRGEVERAGKFALAYYRRLPALRPGIFLAIGEAALRDDAVVVAYEYAFLEIHGAGAEGAYHKPAEALFHKCLNDQRSKVMQVLLWWHDFCRQSMQHRDKAGLQTCLDVMNDLISKFGTLISFRQLKAEVLADLGRLGDSGATESAAKMLAELNEDHPWFVPAYVQACHLAFEAGDQPRARELLQHAQGLAPFHAQVDIARDRIFNLRPVNI